MSVGFDTWFNKSCPTTVFIVKNIAPKGKRIHLFQYPVENQQTRDLLSIPGVSEADIRHALLKGALKTKIVNGEVTITQSNIDLLQFDECQYDFLRSAGIIDGLAVEGTGGSTDGYSFPVVFRQAVALSGTYDESNRIFIIPNSEKFVNGNINVNGTSLSHSFKILIRHNGKGLIEGVDYVVAESVTGMGFDTVVFTSFAPKTIDYGTLVADYVVSIQ